jgi:large subunit ribosomal protein L31
MKAKIHPQYYPNAKVTCACGNTFTTGSTMPEIKVDICSACHPFFTGEMKYVDTQGRVEKFQKRMKATAGKTYLSKKKRQAKQKARELAQAQKTPKTLREMLLTKKPTAPKKPSLAQSQDKKQ